jgi:hypothetical protein
LGKKSSKSAMTQICVPLRQLLLLADAGLDIPMDMSLRSWTRQVLYMYFSASKYKYSLGLNDSENRDTEIIHDIVTRLRHNKCVNMFLIVRNGQEVRMTNTYADMLRTFEMIFGV